jgi:hypothetical protein
MDHYEVPYNFDYVYHLKFLDVGFDLLAGGAHAMTDDDALLVYNTLKTSLHYGNNVVVSCIAGQNRSGSIAQVGNALGFDITPRTNFAFGNEVVKSKLMKLVNGYE